MFMVALIRMFCIFLISELYAWIPTCYIDTITTTRKDLDFSSLSFSTCVIVSFGGDERQTGAPIHWPPPYPVFTLSVVG